MKKIFLLFSILLTAVFTFGQDVNLDEVVKNDPRVRIGKLSNGMTYYIQHNENPKGRAFFYIAQKVGSVQEDEDHNEIAMLWVDGMPYHLTSDQEGLYWSWAMEVIGYGDDWYALSLEMYDVPGDQYSISIVVWLNGEVYRRFHGIDIVNFTVL